MWHEARKQERKIRGMLVDYRRRAERRQDFYEKIRADPTQFMQIHGRKCKIHLDPSVASAGESSAIMMPWLGQTDNLIDRFDVRAHLDYIPPIPKPDDVEDLSIEERHCNYERYRILAQNEFLGITEDRYLHQLHLEEQFGARATVELEKPKKKPTGGAAIGYTYEDSELPTTPFNPVTLNTAPPNPPEEESDSDIDMDMSIDIAKIDTNQAHELNGCGRNFGMNGNDFFSYLTKDADEADALRLAHEEEQEKIMLSGRKSRRERRAQRERKFHFRAISPSYAAKEEKNALGEINVDGHNDTDSRSPSPENSGKITYITSFGGEDELQPHSKISINFNKTSNTAQQSSSAVNKSISYADKVKENLEKLKASNQESSKSFSKKPLAYQRRFSSDSNEKKSVRYNRRRGRDRSKSRSRSRSKVNRRRRRSSSSSYSDRSRRSRRKSRRYYSSSSSSKSSRSSSSSSSSDSSRSRSRSRSKSSRSVRDTKPPTRIEKPVIIIETPVPIPVEKEPPVVVQVPLPQPPFKRYYGRKKEDLSSSESAEENNDDVIVAKDKIQTQSEIGQSINSNNWLGKTTDNNENKEKSNMKITVNPRDRLKRKMQILLNKQYKADKQAEIEKTERQIQLQQERDDEMRELALRLRRRQRELRHRYGSPTESTSTKSSDDTKAVSSQDKKVDRRSRSLSREKRSKSRSRSRSKSRTRTRSRSRSRSRSRTRSHSRGRMRHRSRSRERTSAVTRRRSPVRYTHSNRNIDRRNYRDSGIRRYRNDYREQNYSRKRRSRSYSRSRSRDRYYSSSSRNRDRNSPKHKKLVDY